ncbi:MAG: extracellular solute-binding protein, partial [Defluviitaleaceae bacterium]|nr:extracellular solute-binding protein [Defluviitaleaceae bacterium]
MKKVLTCLLAALMIFGLCACSGAGSSGGGAASTPTPTQAPAAQPTEAPADTTTETAVDTPAETVVETPAEPVVEPEPEEPMKIVEVSLTLFDRGVPAEAGTPEDNATITFLNEQLNKIGVNIKVYGVVRYDSRTIMNTWIAAGTAPDLLYEYSQPWLYQLYMQGTLMALDGPIEQYSKEYKAYAQKTADMLAPFIKYDGSTYALTSLRGVSSVPVAALWYRKDILDQTSFSGPIDTVEQLIEAARSIKAWDNSMVPFGHSPHYHNMFRSIYGLTGNWYPDASGDMVYDIYTQNYFDYMTTLRLNYQEGLIDQEYFTDDNYARRNQNVITGKTAINVDSWGPPAGFDELYAVDPNVDWIPLGTVASSYGTFMPTPQLIPYLYLMFTKGMSDEKVEAAFKFVDWLLRAKDDPSPSPFGNHYNWQDIARGLEGVHWNFNENGLRQNEENPATIWVLGGETAVIQDPPKMQRGELEAEGKNAYERE